MAALIQMHNNVAGVKVLLLAPTCRLGRGDENDVVIDDDLISREHAVVERLSVAGADDNAHFIIRDLGSTNGTFINHKQIKEALLNDGDTIRIGQTFFQFSLKERGEPGATKVLKKTIIPGVYYTTDKKD